MSTSVDQAFIITYGSDVKLAYQRQGTVLSPFCRVVNDVKDKHRFFKLGKGTASQKARHGLVPVMNALHTYVDVSPQDWYAGDFVDMLDLNRISIDERQVIAQTGAYALGRKVDDLIQTAVIAGASATIAAGGTGLTKTKALTLLQNFNDADVPDDGGRVCFVGSKPWNDLLGIDEFVNSRYVGNANGQGVMVNPDRMRQWLGIWWVRYTGIASTGTIKNFAFHKTAVGLAQNTDIVPDITWQGTRAAWFINNMIQANAAVIDSLATFELDTV